jgi:uncharacterized protein
MSQNKFTLLVKVIPKSSKNEIVGWENEELKIKLRALPEKGEANEALIAFLAKELKIPKMNIQLVGGLKSRHKRLIITGVSKNLLEALAKR